MSSPSSKTPAPKRNCCSPPLKRSVISVRRRRLEDLLADLADSDDEEIAEAAGEAIEMAELREDEDGEEAGEDWIN